ncbi:MAG TPA: hypothetical protein VFN19_01590 [Candidatus Nanopelagicales bacterium]|jgi:hypothetical protein|nr:hypothetical protein [Candidatus Nanopelagicales bacterium]
MLIASVDEIRSTSFADHRGPGISFQRLLKGHEGSPDNFELSVVHTGAEYRTPRHRHNFDQILYVLEGTHEYAPKSQMPTGTVTYTPEGTHYGPQVGHGATTLLLQFGGPTGNGFMSYDQLSAGNKALAERGAFEKGIFRFVDESGRTRNQDGYEAIWEHVNGAPVHYPPQRYDHPITMWPEHFSWVASPDEPGVAHRRLASFAGRGTAVAFLHLDADARHTVPAADATRLHFVVRGCVRTGEQEHPARTALQLDPGESVGYVASSDSELLCLTLPAFPR